MGRSTEPTHIVVPEPYSGGDQVRIYLDPADPDADTHDTVCEITDVLTDDLIPRRTDYWMSLPTGSEISKPASNSRWPFAIGASCPSTTPSSYFSRSTQIPIGSAVCNRFHVSTDRCTRQKSSLPGVIRPCLSRCFLKQNHPALQTRSQQLPRPEDILELTHTGRLFES